MGFFKKSVPSELKRTALTIIARGNKICGEMSITGKLHIDGNVEGNITSVENVSIGKTGSVTGRIQAKNITVSGLLRGDVSCEHLHIAAGGRVESKVESIELTMDAKSHFIGERREADALTIEMLNLKLELEKTSEKELDVIDDLPSKITLTTLDSSKSSNLSKTEDLTTKERSALAESKTTVNLAGNELTDVPDKKKSKPFTENVNAVENNIVSTKLFKNTADKSARVEKSRLPNTKKAHSEMCNAQINKPKVVDENTTKLELKF